MISLGAMAASRSIRIAGDEIDEAIVAYARQAFNLLIGDRMAEDCKITIGSADRLEQETSMEIRGRDLITGLPRMTRHHVPTGTRSDLRPHQCDCGDRERDFGRHAAGTFRRHHGQRDHVLAGGGALLRGLDRLISRETGNARPHRSGPPLLRRAGNRQVSGRGFTRSSAAAKRAPERDAPWPLHLAGALMDHVPDDAGRGEHKVRPDTSAETTSRKDFLCDLSATTGVGVHCSFSCLPAAC